jgi:hypothetical protein
MGRAQVNNQNRHVCAHKAHDGFVGDTTKQNVPYVGFQVIHAAERRIGAGLDVEFPISGQATAFEDAIGFGSIVLRGELIRGRGQLFGNGRKDGRLAGRQTGFDRNGAHARTG